MESAAPVKRIEYYDFLRGIAIVMVVAIHTMGVIYEYSAISFTAVLIRQILSCAVPVFCVSSAFFLIQKDIQGKRYKEYLLKQCIRVYVPLLVFSVPYLLHDLLDKKDKIISMLKFIGGGYSIYYFAALIIQFYILLPLFQKYKILRNLWVMGSISFLWVFVYVYIVQPVHPLPLVLYGGPICCFIVYFALGSALQQDKLREHIPIPLCIITTCLMLVISCAEAYFLMERNGSLTGMGLKPSAVLFSVCMCLILYSDTCAANYSENTVSKQLCNLGRYSYGIYLLHMYCLSVLHKLIVKTGCEITVCRLFWWAAYTFVVLLLSYILLRFAKRIHPKVSRLCLGV